MIRLGPWFGLFLLALAAAAFLAPFASPAPDGFDRVAEDHGFADQGRSLQPALLPDYAFPGVGPARLSTAAAGLAGTALTLGAAWLVASLLHRRKSGA